MTFQEAAQKIIKENGQPLAPEEIAQIAYARRMVKSKATNPTRSFVETIKKNIRGNIYNHPELTITKNINEQLIGLSEWK